MVEWFRSWHGAPSDKKLKVCARHASVTQCHAVSLWWHMLDAASRNDPRGNIGNIDAEDWAIEIDEDIETTQRLIEAFISKNLIDPEGNVTAWNKRQPKKEDTTAASRKRKQRERDKDESHDTSQNVTPKSRHVTTEEKRRESPLYPPAGGTSENEVRSSPEGDNIFEAVDALLSRIWPDAPKAMDARLLEAECNEFARLGATPKITVDALTARLWHIAGHSRNPPRQLEPWGGELVLTRLQRMARVKRGNADWQVDWGPEPSETELAAFEIPVDLRLASDPPPGQRPTKPPSAEPDDGRYPEIPAHLRRTADA